MVSLKIDNLFSHVVQNSVADNRQPASRHLSPFTIHRSSPRGGFTLIELLIVTVVIVTLMGIVFRLAGVGGNSSAKARTQARLQRLENAVAGYYAAYGSYPPVPLQGRSRDINAKVDRNGVQGDVVKEGYNNITLDNPDDQTVLKQIEAACRAQPVAVLFPFFGSKYDREGDQKSKADNLVAALASNSDGGFSPLNNIGGLNLGKENEATLFQFGLLSFLLPRYQFMLCGPSEMYDMPHCQWRKNNQLPCRIDTGIPYESWEDIQKIKYQDTKADERFLLENLTSQAVCARWMPNLEKIISGGLEFYGVNTAEPHPHLHYLMGKKYDALPGDKKWRRVFSRNGYGNQSDYLLNGMTVLDGWDREFYYYSDTPYQSYSLWSAGSNGKTFPPWLMEHLDSYGTKAQETITGWTSDDVSHMAN